MHPVALRWAACRVVGSGGSGKEHLCLGPSLTIHCGGGAQEKPQSHSSGLRALNK